MPTVEQLYDEADRLKDESKFEEAIAKLTELHGQDEQHALAHLALAVLYGKVGKHEEAVRHGERACELEPNDSFSFTAMSVTYQRAFQGTQNQRYVHLAEDAMAKSHTLEGGH